MAMARLREQAMTGMGVWAAVAFTGTMFGNGIEIGTRDSVLTSDFSLLVAQHDPERLKWVVRRHP